MFYFKYENIKIFIFAICLIFTISSNFNYKENSTEVFSNNLSNKVIVIDPGHGSPDSGAIGINMTLEKDLNLIISKKIGELFQKSGAYVIYTREDDNCAYSDLSKKLREIKNLDIKKRKEIKKNSNADIFISIHMNSYPDSKYKGAQVFYNSKNDNNKILANTIMDCIKKYADNSNNREIKVNNNLFMLTECSIASVLIECGFISNPQEEKLLNTSEYQDKLALAIYLGVQQYLND